MTEPESDGAADAERTSPETVFAPNQGRGMGWVPDLPDFRDYRFSFTNSYSLMDQAALPRQFSLREFQSPVRDQWYLGSCTGFAICAGVECLRRIDADEFSTVYSPLWLYHEERVAEETLHVDCGAYIRTGVKIVTEVGLPPESRWRYPDGASQESPLFAATPTESAYREARRWRLGAYHRCVTLTDVLNALVKKKPVVLGFSCYTSIYQESVWETGVIPVPTYTERQVGGHAVLAVGFDQDTRLVQFKNSWGEDWGDGGYGYLPFTYFLRPGLSGDYWALSSESPQTTGWDWTPSRERV